MSTVVIAPTIVSAGNDLPADALRMLTSVRVERAVNVVGQATLRFDDAGYRLSVDSTFKIGGEVTVKVGTTTLFGGTVHSIALETVAGHVPELVVTAREPTQKLAERRTPRVFENKSHAGILQTIVSDRGMKLSVDGPMKRGPVNPYLLQTDTDLAFLDELVRTRDGMWWWDAPSSTIRVAPAGPPPGAPVELVVGDTPEKPHLLTFSVRATAGQPPSAQAVGWDPVSSENSVLGDAKPATTEPESTFVHGARKPSSPPRGIVTNAGVPHDPQEAKLVAGAILGSARADVVSGRGTCRVDPRIAPGVSVKVAQAGPSSGTYLVTRVDHVYDRRGFHTTFHTGSHRPRGLVDTLGQQSEPDSRIDGVVVGIVTDLQDEKELGRVRVKFPVLQERPDKEVVSAWARVASFDAGRDRGAVFLPEVNDEVLVAFESGDLRRPVVLGALFSGRHKQRDLRTLLSGNGEIHSRRITSRAGHVFEMVDQKGKTKMLLKHGKKPFSITMDEQTSAITVEAKGGDIKLTTGEATLTLDASGNITIDGLSLKITTKQNVAVDAKLNADIKAGVNLSAEGTNTTVKGKATTTVQGGAATTIKGGTVAIN